MKVKIYQIAPERDSRRLLFMNHDYAVDHGDVKPEEYKCVFDGNVSAHSLEELYAELNEHKPVGYNGHSLSVSDVVELDDKSFHYCDSIGFVRLRNFDSSLAEPIKGHRMLVLEPHKAPYEMEIPDTVEALQQAVGGYFECSYPFDDNAIVFSNECAKLEGLDGNRRVGDEIYAGVMLIAADDGYGGTADLTDEQVAYYSQRFALPDEIMPDEVRESVWFEFRAF